MVVNKRQITNFLVATFSLTYLLLFIMIIANNFNVLGFDTPLGMLLYILSTLSPTIMSFFILKKSGLVSGLKEFAKTAFAIKQKPLYYGLVFSLLFLQYIFPALMLKARSDVAWYMGLLMIIPCILDGGLEELGWRYILHPTLEKRFSFFVASSITATIWILWHIPFFFVAGTGQSEMNFIFFSIMVFGFSFAISAIYHVTKSVWLCILCHAIFNAFSFYWPMAQEFTTTLISTTCSVIISTAIVFLTDSKRIKQHKLS